MGFMTIDGQRVEFTNEPNVLTVIRNAEIDIPTLCCGIDSLSTVTVCVAG